MGQAAPSKFNASSTAVEVVKGIDLTGKNIIVTGASSGIGIDTARELAGQGAHVIMACRDTNKATAVTQTFDEATRGRVEVMQLDLASLASVRTFVDNFNAKNVPLHVLINNAGVMACPALKTEDGFEMQFGVNHLGHFLLTNLLVPRLKEGSPSRVVCVSSAAHRHSGIHFDDLMLEKSYGPWVAYGQSKSANILFAQEFDKRFSAEGIYANSVHPGVIFETDLLRHQFVRKIPGFTTIAKPFEWMGVLKSLNGGAATQVMVATAPELERTGGLFFADCQPATPAVHASRPEDAERLWETSVKLVGL